MKEPFCTLLPDRCPGNSFSTISLGVLKGLLAAFPLTFAGRRKYLATTVTLRRQQQQQVVQKVFAATGLVISSPPPRFLRAEQGVKYLGFCDRFSQFLSTHDTQFLAPFGSSNVEMSTKKSLSLALRCQLCNDCVFRPKKLISPGKKINKYQVFFFFSHFWYFPSEWLKSHYGSKSGNGNARLRRRLLLTQIFCQTGRRAEIISFCVREKRDGEAGGG